MIVTGNDAVNELVKEKLQKTGSRLKSLRKDLGFTQKQLGESLGVTQGFYGGIEKSRYSIPLEVLLKLKEIYNVNPNWVLTGEGSTFLEQNVNEDETLSDNLSDFVSLPLISCRISAGNDAVDIDDIEATLMFKRNWLSKFGDPQKLSLIEVAGDSMEPTFKSGDIILVNHNQNFLDKAGGIYAIAIKNNEDSIIVKRLQYDCQSGKILVISDNKLYRTFLVSEDEIAINGRVVWYGRKI
ncbi:S24 family peptidase [Desulfurella sp.]|uniref:XRE family transcriptional regulator n=1 Tax=Desulfurella sp. TaxID=1962857 RepID=UPI0025C521C1|nr:S24 family peptidase [Desulfurella sp.]